jgi:hypothetical protein
MTDLNRILSELQTDQLKYMLEDLRDPEKRTPALMRAIQDELKRNNITVSKVNKDLSQLGKQFNSLPSLDQEYLDDPTSLKVVQLRKVSGLGSSDSV